MTGRKRGLVPSPMRRGCDPRQRGCDPNRPVGIMTMASMKFFLHLICRNKYSRDGRKHNTASAPRLELIWYRYPAHSTTKRPLLALSGHSAPLIQCPLLGVKRTISGASFALRCPWACILNSRATAGISHWPIIDNLIFRAISEADFVCHPALGAARLCCMDAGHV
jgi:hypothetical protein